MRLAGRAAAVLTTEDGEQILNSFGVELPALRMFLASIEDSDDMGLWLRIENEDHLRLLLLRWEYVLGIDLVSGLGKVIGLKG